MNIWNDIKASYKKGSTLNKVLFINTGVFIAIRLLIMLVQMRVIPEGVYLNILHWGFTFPANATDALLSFWTAITYMFSHEGLRHFIFNMLVLYWLGRIFVEFLNGKRFLTVYILGGLSGAALFFISYNIFYFVESNHQLHVLIGASASIMAVVFAVAAYLPDYSLYLILIGPVKLKWIALVSFIMDVLMLSDNTGGHIAHIGGALFGLYWGLQLKKGTDIARGFTKFLDTFFSFFKPKSNLQTSYRNPNRQYGGSNYGSTMSKNDQNVMDRILDKIKQSGYDSLSEKEKEILFRMGNKK